MPGRRDGLHAHAAAAPALLGEAVVEQAADAAAPVIGVDADEVHVPRSRRALGRDDEAEQKADHLRALLDDERLVAQLVEEDGVREGPDGTAPPVVDDLGDAVEVGFRDATDVHGAGGGA